MSTIKLTANTFSLCPEGSHVFRITKVDYNEDFGRLTLYLVNGKGNTLRENFFLQRQDGTMNEGACNAFSYLARTALNDMSREAIDPVELIGKYVGSEVKHTYGTDKTDPTKTVTYASLTGKKWSASGFETTEATEAPSNTGLDLNALLG